MNATGIPDLTQTAAELSQANARIAAIAQSACADCLTMQARIDELEGALTDAEFLLRKVGINWKEAGSMKDSFLRCSEDARAILAKGTQ